jgi:hypothetical protein
MRQWRRQPDESQRQPLIRLLAVAAVAIWGALSQTFLPNSLMGSSVKRYQERHYRHFMWRKPPPNPTVLAGG